MLSRKEMGKERVCEVGRQVQDQEGAADIDTIDLGETHQKGPSKDLK